MNAPQPGQDVPDELLQLTSELFSSWYGQDLDFTDEARTLLAAVAPAIRKDERAKVAEEARARAADMKGVSRIAWHALAEFANLLDEDLAARGTS